LAGDIFVASSYESAAPRTAELEKRMSLSFLAATTGFMASLGSVKFAPSRGAVVMLDVVAQPSVMTECLLLPGEPYSGAPPISITGEVMLQELEDDQETRTQVFLNQDGTISLGATDGPPPAGFCGLWQCGSDKFQMTLSRGFSTPSVTLERGQLGQMADEIAYTVVRVYEGAVDASSTGVGIVNGRIDLVKDDDKQGWAASGATSIAAYDPFASIETPPIGYFVMDANTASELYDEAAASEPPSLWEAYQLKRQREEAAARQ